VEGGYRDTGADEDDVRDEKDEGMREKAFHDG
jgi:hypothetical protein